MGKRLIKVLDSERDLVAGTSAQTGRQWKFEPHSLWTDSHYEIVISPNLEDVAGNRPYSAFDSIGGGKAPSVTPLSLEFTTR